MKDKITIPAEMWQTAKNLTFLFLTYRTPEPQIVGDATSTGATIIYHIYLLHRESTKPNDVYIKARDDLIKEFSSKHPSLTDGNMQFYFDFCSYAGMQFAEGAPENIGEMVSHLYGRKPGTKR